MWPMGLWFTVHFLMKQPVSSVVASGKGFTSLIQLQRGIVVQNGNTCIYIATDFP